VSTPGVRRFVKDLLGRRRPRRFRAGPGEEAELRTAILLRAARPGGGAPSEEFVAGLRNRLAVALGDEPPPSRSGRRRFVQLTSAAAAAAALGAGADHLIAAGGTEKPPDTAAPPPDRTLRPNTGEWRAVVAAKDLPEGGVRAFDTGAFAGFVTRSGGRLRAVSGTCTHLGCKLALDSAARQLNCPCHRTGFAVDGTVVFHQLPLAPPALPRLQVRESAGMIEVLVPPQRA
jgi:nitrite reductase/ring-hydroxylating ferredoxin subunit